VDLSGGGAVASITVTPAAATLNAVGATQQFVADVRDASGGVVNGTVVTWSSSDAAVATIDAASGLATAAGAGTSTIRASVGNVSGTAALTVDLSATTIASIVVTPATRALGALGVTQQYVAEARNAAGQPIPGVVFTWVSTDPLVATIDGGSGLATTSGEGSTTIQASAGGVTGSATLAVDISGNTAVASITVTPPNALLSALGDVQQFSAVARDANGNIVAGASFTWTSTNAAVASVDGSTGLATAVANGSTVITASANGVSGTAVLDVTQQVASIVVSPDSVRVETIGDVVQFTAAAFDGNGHAVPGVVFAWSSSHPIIASIDPATGLATTNDGGIVTIMATAQGVSGTAVLVVRR
jgi:uncharacterized protein YjdB